MATPAPGAAPVSRQTQAWRAHWLAEIIRLREEHWGPLEDADAVRQARNAPGTLETRILMRARLLAQREGHDGLAARWRQGAVYSLLGLLAAAVIAGVASAAGALGDGSRPVNVLWALGALLGIHLLTLLLWLASFLLPPGGATGLGRLWLWATRKLARGPDAALVPQALLNLLGRAGARRWLFGAISHGLWLAALAAALITLLALLSTASYRFVWATTLLQPDAFIFLTRALGWLPAQFGFAMPSADVVRASDNTQVLPAVAQAQWSIWLIGVIAIYGVLPRLVACTLCLLRLRQARRGLRIDAALPGYAALRDRLVPPVQSTGIDRPADPLHQPRVAAGNIGNLADMPVLVGLELPADVPWPPVGLPPGVQDAGNLDSREQRNRLLDALAHAGARRLLIACDARQTPDRGTLNLIAALSGKAGQTRVWLYTAASALPPAVQARLDVWRDRLAASGMTSQAIVRDTDEPLRWLETGHD